MNSWGLQWNSWGLQWNSWDLQWKWLEIKGLYLWKVKPEWHRFEGVLTRKPGKIRAFTLEIAGVYSRIAEDYSE